MPELVAGLLVDRGFGEVEVARGFLEPRFKDLYSPELLPNLGMGADRIVRAVRAGEKITLFGDYDVDGITGTAMLWHTLTAAGARVETYVPHRVEEGYGLNVEAVRGIAGGGTKLLVTVDCGCSAVEAIGVARELGMDVVVSDHHEFGAEVPAATALVHPRAKWMGEEEEGKGASPNADLCGAGVAFKLAWAVAQKLCGTERVNEVYRGLLMEFAALAALGTIADVVPLVGGGNENRILVTYGLRQLARTKMAGLLALIHAAGFGEEGRVVDCMAVGFSLAPRLNAAGRMGHAREAVELLTTAEGQRAEEIAAYLEEQNKERQATEKKMVEAAREQIAAAKETMGNILVVAHENFHVGVVGIVASRLVDAFYRPTFVLAKGEREYHGSARSIAGFELHEAIEHVRDLLTSGGGHAMAGGVKFPHGNLEAFRERLNAFGAERLSEEMLVPVMRVDGVMELAECVPGVVKAMERLAPFGRGNPRPRFLLEGVRLTAPPRRVGSTGAHVQMTIGKDGRVGRGIAFKMGSLAEQLRVGEELNLVVEPKVDVFNGREKVDLVICDVARCSGEAFEVGG